MSVESGNPFGALQMLAEQRIREAQEAGQFDNLPGTGAPLKLEDMSHIPPELRMAYKILKNAGCLPPELAMRKDMEQICKLLDNCHEERERIRQMRKLRFLLERMTHGAARHAMLEANDEYYCKILGVLERYEREAGQPR